MAVDTAEKRAAALNWNAAGTWRTMPIPIGTIGAAQRAHLLGLYSGFGTPTPPSFNVAVLGRISIEISLSLS